jgi:hypothetical protein
VKAYDDIRALADSIRDFAKHQQTQKEVRKEDLLKLA